MPAPLTHEQREKVVAFRSRHRLGVVTLLFTDIVGSTQLKQQLGDYQAVQSIQDHHAVVREVLAGFSEGEEIATAGDSFFIVFSKPSDAVKFSLLAQTRVRQLAQQSGVEIFDRIGIHVGEVFIDEAGGESELKDLYGIQVDTCARVMSLGQGDQVLMSRFVFDNARQVLKGQDLPGLEALSWLNHGTYQLKGVEEPVVVCEVGEAGRAVLTAPPDSEKASRHVAAGEEPVLGWRPAVGQVVPQTKWVLDRKLGEGGFGEVWLGRHEQLREERVFKFCFKADRVRYLKRELTLFKVMREQCGAHPRIVGVQEVNLEQAPYYLMMEYAPGRSLDRWVEEQGGLGAVSGEVKLEIAAQVAEALGAAHGAGVIHRDVKPGNILVEGNGREVESLRVKLTDFGVGRVVSEEILSGRTQGGLTKTLAGEGVGTPMYLAPEVMEGKAASAASDIYALGVVLFQMWAGSFKGAISRDSLDLIESPLMQDTFQYCLAADSEKRSASASEVATELRKLIRSERHRQRWLKKAALIKKLVRMVSCLVLGGFLFAAAIFGLWGISWVVEKKYGDAVVCCLAMSIVLVLSYGWYLKHIKPPIDKQLIWLDRRFWGGKKASRPKAIKQRHHRFARTMGLVFACVFMFYLIEYGRGKLRWEAHVAELQSQGIPAFWRMAPQPRIPEASNFCATPLLKAIGSKQKQNESVLTEFKSKPMDSLWNYSGDYIQGKKFDFQGYYEYMALTSKNLAGAPASLLLNSLQSWETELKELRNASLRPHARFMPRVVDDPTQLDWPNIFVYRTLAQVCSYHATAHLGLHQPESAYADLWVMNRLAESNAAADTLVEAMISCAIYGLSVQVFWEGWADRQWSGPQLERLRDHFLNVRIVEGVQRALIEGVACLAPTSLLKLNKSFYEVFQYAKLSDIVRPSSGSEVNVRSEVKVQWDRVAFSVIQNITPRGWIYQNLYYCSQMAHESMSSGYDATNQWYHPSQVYPWEEVERRLKAIPYPYGILTRIAMPNFLPARRAAAQNQAMVDEAAVVCALELYRLVHGQYPQQLRELVSAYIRTVPQDVIRGEPLHYRPTPDGGFLLYSVGWNEKDDHGRWDLKDHTQGDWAWTWPVGN